MIYTDTSLYIERTKGVFRIEEYTYKDYNYRKI